MRCVRIAVSGQHAHHITYGMKRKGHSMTLGLEKTRHFYRLLAGLGNYTNKKLKVTPDFQGDNYGDGDGSLDTTRVKVVDAIWSHPQIIDEYLNTAGRDLSAEDRETISSWNRFVKGRFVLERTLKSGGVLVSMEHADQVYLVQNFLSPWEHLANTAGVRIPAMVDTCLLPYDGVIVTDGFARFLSILLGGGIRKIYKEQYLEQKAAGKIRKTL